MQLRFALIVAFVACAPCVSALADGRPNIVVIYADDLGYGDVSCYNPDGKIPTPHIDKLASQGMRFTDGHSSSGVCTPSRYTLLTGRYHWRSRLQRGIVGLWGAPLIAKDRLTVAGMLRSRGYQTAAIGKWHLGWDWPRKGKAIDFTQAIGGGPTTRGFDHYFGTDVPNWPPFCFIEDDRTVGIPDARLDPKLIGNNQASKQGPAIEGWTLEPILPALGDRASKWITKSAKSDTPYFLYMPLTSPHTPLSVNDAWKGKSGINLYADFVMETDAIIGQVLDAIEKSGEADRTLVIFTSDNGCAHYIGMADMAKKGHLASGPLRGSKSDVWEGGHRVAFIARWPGVVEPGAVNEQLVQQADIMATCAEIVGYDLADDEGEDSYSFLPLLRGSNEPIRTHAINQSIHGLLAVRSGSWKLIFGKGSGGWGKGTDSHPGQLYNLADDLGEKNNRYAAEPDRVREMTELMRTLVENGRSKPGEPQKNDVPVKWNRIK